MVMGHQAFMTMRQTLYCLNLVIVSTVHMMNRCSAILTEEVKHTKCGFDLTINLGQTGGTVGCLD